MFGGKPQWKKYWVPSPKTLSVATSSLYFLPQAEDTKLRFWPLYHIFIAGVLLGDFVWRRVWCSLKDYPIIPAKAALIQSSLCSCCQYFIFFLLVNSVISSLFSWFHLLCRFFLIAIEERKYFPKPNFKSNRCIDLLILNSLLPEQGQALSPLPIHLHWQKC